LDAFFDKNVAYRIRNVLVATGNVPTTMQPDGMGRVGLTGINDHQCIEGFWHRVPVFPARSFPLTVWRQYLPSGPADEDLNGRFFVSSKSASADFLASLGFCCC